MNILKNKLKSHSYSTTHFGFKTIPKDQKQSLVANVFTSVASSYDTMNDIMSLGIHRLWKSHLINTLKPTSGQYLDVAGGTGDIAFRIKKFSNHASHVTIVDINPEMLSVGEKKSTDLGLNNIQFVQANAEDLKNIPDNSMDAYTIAFGIRNCTNVDLVLKEAHRVLKPGGRFLCLEFSKVDAIGFKQFYDLYSFNVIPFMGKVVANDSDSYQYLVESIRKFPSQPEFAKMIKDAGFKHVTWENLTMGIAAIHSGYKL